MKYLVALALLANSVVVGQAVAQTPEKVQPKPSDFAMQLPLRVSGENGVVQLNLPLSVYQVAQTANLADVRVFNSAGQAVPFAFFQPSHSTTVSWRESNVKIFPLSADAPNDSAGQMELDVRASQDGSLISVHAKSVGKNIDKSSENRLAALILDLGKAQADEKLDSLQLFLPDGTGTYRANLAIEQSDDLKLWDRVAQSRVDWLRSSPSSLQSDSQSGSSSAELINDRIELSARSGRYVRVQWLEGRPLQFNRIVAHWRRAETQRDDSMEIVLKPAAGKIAGDWIYASSNAIAANEIGLNLPNANTVMPVSIGFYRQQLTPTRKWLFDAITYNTFYRLNQNGVERVSSRIHIGPHIGFQGNSEWVVRPQTATDAAPDLVLRWRPRTIAFTAQGSGNGDRGAFTLAYGASDEKLKQWLTSESPMSLVAPGFSDVELNQLEHATLGQALATPVDTKPQPESVVVESASAKINKRTLLLWGVLIFGTLLLAGMSWRLYRQMNGDSKS